MYSVHPRNGLRKIFCRRSVRKLEPLVPPSAISRSFLSAHVTFREHRQYIRKETYD